MAISRPSLNLRPNQAGALLIAVVFCLVLLGLIVLSSASQSVSASVIFKKQLFWLLPALIAGAFFGVCPLDKIRENTNWVVVLSLLGLVAVLIPGVGMRINGAKRWIVLGPMSLQVSEFAKVGLALGLSHYLALYQRRIQSLLIGFIYPSLIIAAFFLLIILEPDFGTAVLCGLVGFALLFLAGARQSYFWPVVLTGLGAFGIAVWLNPVRLKRITAFLDIEANKTDGAYQLWQGMLAFGAGGVDGIGLGNGRQQFAYLPEAHTDFILAVIGEELGFLFTSGVVLLFFLIFAIGLWQLRRAPSLYEFLLVTASLLFIVLQALINIGVVTGCLPTKGMSLPFISYGGSNLVVMFIFVGIMVNSFRSSQRLSWEKAREI